jgi:hypothetical protein
MNAPKTAGQALRVELDAALPKGIVWDQLELVTIATLEVMADRLARLRKRVDAQLDDPATSAAALAALANATRCLEVSMAHLIKTLDPSDSAATSSKSRQHQAAAMQRWHPGYGS